MEKEPKFTHWVVLCWGGSVFAGPFPEASIPWLFLVEEHAQRYVAELRASGIPAEVRKFFAPTTEYKGRSLLRIPPIPEPYLGAQPNMTDLSSEESKASDGTHHVNGATSSTVPPPPALE